MPTRRSPFAVEGRSGLERLLLEGALRGDPQLEHAFVEHFDPLVRHCARQLLRRVRGGEQDLEDMVGEVWLTLFEDDKRRLRRFDPSRQVQVSTWIGALARHRMIDYVRRLRPTSPLPEDDLVDEAPLPLESLEGRQRLELAQRAMSRLSDKDRAMLAALYDEDTEASALAARLGVSLSTVYTRRFKITFKVGRELARLLAAPRRGCGVAA